MRWRAALGLLTAVVLVVAAGCAAESGRYRLGSTYDESIRTVAAPMFDNVTFATGLEQPLTDAVVKRLQASTPWRVAGEERADTTLRGTITEVRLGLLSASRATGLTEEQSVRITVDFTWRDNRTGQVLASRRNLSATATFVPTSGVRGESGERLEIGQRQAIDELAEAIVSDLRDNW